MAPSEHSLGPGVRGYAARERARPISSKRALSVRFSLGVCLFIAALAAAFATTTFSATTARTRTLLFYAYRAGEYVGCYWVAKVVIEPDDLNVDVGCASFDSLNA